MPYRPHASEVYYLTKKAGEIIMGYYTGKVTVMVKADASPVTHADLAANRFIVEELQKLTPGIPVVSEENDEADNIKAATAPRYWLVDPLDGTKGYIKQTGEFTVNIALIEGGIPQGGAIYVPAQSVGYFTAEDGNAYKQDGPNLPVQIRVRPVPEDGLTVVASHSHRTPETDAYIATLSKVKKLTSAASSLKFCLIAEGAADIYPRFGRTMEWDTGAGQAILEAAGGRVENLDGSRFMYGKQGFENPYFVARG